MRESERKRIPEIYPDAYKNRKILTYEEARDYEPFCFEETTHIQDDPEHEGKYFLTVHEGDYDLLIGIVTNESYESNVSATKEHKEKWHNEKRLHKSS